MIKRLFWTNIIIASDWLTADIYISPVWAYALKAYVNVTIEYAE